LIGLILDVAGIVIALVFEELWEGNIRNGICISMGDEIVADYRIVDLLLVFIVAYAIYVVSSYFYKQAYEILASSNSP
jgi:uncharacterized membrane protein